MRFRNIDKVPRTTPFTTSIRSGVTTADFDFLRKDLKLALKDQKLDILLTDEERNLIQDLLHRDTQARHRNTSNIQPRDELKARSERLEKEHEKEIAIHQAKVEKAHKEAEMFEDRKVSDKTIEIVPRKIEGKPKSLSDILNHNAALDNKQ